MQPLNFALIILISFALMFYGRNISIIHIHHNRHGTSAFYKHYAYDPQIQIPPNFANKCDLTILYLTCVSKTAVVKWNVQLFVWCKYAWHWTKGTDLHTESSETAVFSVCYFVGGHVCDPVRDFYFEHLVIAAKQQAGTCQCCSSSIIRLFMEWQLHYTSTITFQLVRWTFSTLQRDHFIAQCLSQLMALATAAKW